MTIASPERLSDHHAIEDFSSGAASLDDWLKRRALKNQIADASRIFVACEAARVVGFYVLASGGVQAMAAPGRFRRNMLEPMTLMVTLAELRRAL